MKPLFLLLIPAALLAQPPRIANAKVETRSGANLQSVFHSILAAQDSPAWVGYTVPATPGEHNSCCWQDGYRGCALEGQNRMPAVATTGPVMLESSSTVVILYRIANHAVDKTRPVSGDCELDGGGLPFIHLTGVQPSESIAYLRSLVTEKNHQPLVSISMHGDPSAINVLLDEAKNNASPKVRGQALFWVAQRAGQRETAAIASALDNDPDVEVKKKAVFALTQVPANEGVPKLIEVARSNRTPQVRKQAMFWLGQSKDPRALAFFQEILTK